MRVMTTNGKEGTPKNTVGSLTTDALAAHMPRSLVLPKSLSRHRPVTLSALVCEPPRWPAFRIGAAFGVSVCLHIMQGCFNNQHDLLM
jgi:hypothetical protein